MACVSELESAHEIIVKAEFPDDILGRSGDSGDVIEWKCCYWKLWDAECLITRRNPCEAIDPRDVGIEDSYLVSLGHPTPCIPLLRTTEECLDYGGRKGYILTKNFRPVERYAYWIMFVFLWYMATLYGFSLL